MSILGFLIVLPPIVIIHELGHFLLARANGVGVEKFSIGFGADKHAIFSWRDKRGTKWQITPYLLGGFVTMKGQYDNPDDQKKYNKGAKKLSLKEKQESFIFKNRARKASIIFAGPAFNLIFSAVILFGLAVSYGSAIIPATIGGFAENSVAQKAGMMVGDTIVKIDGKDIDEFAEILKAMDASKGEKITITVEREIVAKSRDVGATVQRKAITTKTFEVMPMKMGDSYKLGIYSAQNTVAFKKMSVREGAIYAVSHTYNLIMDFFKGIKQMLTGSRSSKEVGGIIAIADISGKALHTGFYAVMYLMALLSIIVGVMNLLPVPVLDGGQLFIYGFEAIIRRDISDNIKVKIFALGWLMILALMLLATYNDLRRVIFEPESGNTAQAGHVHTENCNHKVEK